MRRGVYNLGMPNIYRALLLACLTVSLRGQGETTSAIAGAGTDPAALGPDR